MATLKESLEMKAQLAKQMYDVYNNSGVQQVVKVPVISTEDDAQPNE